MAYINASGQMDNNLGLLNRMQTLTVALTAAQIIAMGTTPVQILPAPGPNRAYLVDSILFQMKPGSVQFTTGGTVSFSYAGGGATINTGNLIPASVINAATGSNTLVPGATATLTVPTNTAINIAASAAFAAGNGTALVTVRFDVQNLG